MSAPTLKVARALKVAREAQVSPVEASCEMGVVGRWSPMGNAKDRGGQEEAIEVGDGCGVGHQPQLQQWQKREAGGRGD